MSTTAAENDGLVVALALMTPLCLLAGGICGIEQAQTWARVGQACIGTIGVGILASGLLYGSMRAQPGDDIALGFGGGVFAFGAIGGVGCIIGMLIRLAWQAAKVTPKGIE